MSVLEALSRSVPVAATAVGGIPELVTHGREGLLLAPPPSPRALARCLARLYDDRTLLSAVRAGAARRGREILTASEVAARFLAEIEGIG